MTTARRPKPAVLVIQAATRRRVVLAFARQGLAATVAPIDRALTSARTMWQPNIDAGTGRRAARMSTFGTRIGTVLVQALSAAVASSGTPTLSLTTAPAARLAPQENRVAMRTHRARASRTVRTGSVVMMDVEARADRV